MNVEGGGSGWETKRDHRKYITNENLLNLLFSTCLFCNRVLPFIFFFFFHFFFSNSILSLRPLSPFRTVSTRSLVFLSLLNSQPDGSNLFENVLFRFISILQTTFPRRASFFRKLLPLSVTQCLFHSPPPPPRPFTRRNVMRQTANVVQQFPISSNNFQTPYSLRS